MKNAFTVDLEDWFCSHNLRSAIRAQDWAYCQSRIIHNTTRLLALLKEFRVEATFFVLGWVAEKAPLLIKEIEEAGHEIATHGYSHTLLTEMTPASFRHDLERALDVTGNLVADSIIGFRAPAFTITRKTLWATDILRDIGMLYDSSVYPFSYHPDYGMPDAPLSIYRYPNSLIEVPLTCVEFVRTRIPCGGGGYFRLLPYRVFRRLIRACNDGGRPAIFCLHPWEIDPDQPQVRLPSVQKFRHYIGLARTAERLRGLLSDFEFTSVRTLLRSEGALPA